MVERQEISPEVFWEDKDHDEWVAREYVGKRQRTVTVIESGSRVRYRVGLNELDEVVADRMILDPFAPAPEPIRIDLSDYQIREEEEPDSEGGRDQARIREMADELLAEYVPESRQA